MKSFIVYEKTDGKIMRCGFCQEIDFNRQAGEGQGVIEHEKVNDEFYKVDLNTLEVVPIT